jgi:hypothetical protein
LTKPNEELEEEEEVMEHKTKFFVAPKQVESTCSSLIPTTKSM